MDELLALLQAGVEEQVFPGGAFAVGGDDFIQFGFAGRHDYDQVSPPISAGTWFDLASLTKPLATTTSALLLWRDGALRLDAPVADVLPEFGGIGREAVTFRHLLNHSSGLPAHKDYWRLHQPDRWPSILAEQLLAKPGEVTSYSCVGFLVLQQALLALTAERYHDAWTWPFFRVVESLGAEVCFNPSEMTQQTCAPTEGGLRGVVHDENSRSLGGMTGNAGLFGTAAGVAALTRWWMQQPEREWISAHHPSSRALGWDTNLGFGSSAGRTMREECFGHTGFTGTSIWIDPVDRFFGVLLTNRVNPSRENVSIQSYRLRFYHQLSVCWSQIKNQLT